MVVRASIDKEEEKEGNMAKKIIVILWAFFLVGCGFVVEDPSSEEMDYTLMVQSVRSLTVGRNSSYALSTPGTNERYPHVYHTPWGKTYLFYTKDGEGGYHHLYAAEMDSEGNFAPPQRIRESMMSPSYAIFDGKKGGSRVPVMWVEYGFYELKPDLTLEYILNSDSQLSSLMVWNGSSWETWGVYGNGETWFRVEVKNDGSWSIQETPLIENNYDIVSFLSPPIGGVGVITGGETNFVLLLTREKDWTGPPFVFQQLVITIKGAQPNITSSNWILDSTLKGVYSPFVDALGGYQIYFSWQEVGANPLFQMGDLYRFRYLTWDKLMPRDIRAKLP